MTIKKDILNFTRIGVNDGGSQNSCSFLYELHLQDNSKNYLVICFYDSAIFHLAKKIGFKTIVIPRKIKDRIKLELCCNKIFEHNQLCFTFFGSPWIPSQGYLLNMSGMADSNLLYPEIQFWKHLKVSTRLYKYLKDRGRIFGYSRADYWIFETEILAERAVELANYPHNRVSVVKMAASSFVNPKNIHNAKLQEFKKTIGDNFSLLFLAGPNPNKRIHCAIPAVKQLVDKHDFSNIKIITTLNNSSNYYFFLKNQFKLYDIENCWLNLGPINYDDVPSIIHGSDIVCLFSVLESFSNNCIEAWSMNKPLLITDSDWARSSCGDAAVYVNPEDINDVANKILYLSNNKNAVNLVSRYQNQFQNYPSAKEKCLLYLNAMDNLKTVGHLNINERHKIAKFFI